MWYAGLDQRPGRRKSVEVQYPHNPNRNASSEEEQEDLFQPCDRSMCEMPPEEDQMHWPDGVRTMLAKGVNCSKKVPSPCTPHDGSMSTTKSAIVGTL
ncbi:hypothetical protein LTR49_027695 [Elasticomyces elasticus]|nr:hypothetical protein LTR49_027695 [Elasticomyces elasticus]